MNVSHETVTRNMRARGWCANLYDLSDQIRQDFIDDEIDCPPGTQAYCSLDADHEEDCASRTIVLSEGDEQPQEGRV